MRSLFKKLPGVMVLGLGTVLMAWAVYSCFSPPHRQPVAAGEMHRICPPTVSEMLGFDEDTERSQSVVAMAVGGAAIFLGVAYLRRPLEQVDRYEL